MLTCIAISPTTVTVKIAGRDFEEQLTKFKRDVPYEHRRFDGVKFIVKNANQLRHLSYIDNAIKGYSKQERML